MRGPDVQAPHFLLSQESSGGRRGGTPTFCFAIAKQWGWILDWRGCRRITRGLFALSLVLSLLAVPLATGAQQPAKVYRIGYLGVTSASATAHLIQAFQLGLREFGYIEGQNITIEYRWAGGRNDRLPGLAAELVRLKVDVIVVGPPPAALAARNATKTIPIVFAAGVDPVASGLVASLARPGGNVTGLATISPELSGKRLQLLKEAVPTISRVAVFWTPTNPSHGQALEEAEAAAEILRLQLQPVEYRTPDDFESAFQAATRERASALMVLDDPVSFSQRARIVGLAARSRLPAIYGFREFAEAGGLIIYGPSLPDQWRRAAEYVHKILKGAKPAALPVEQPIKFELLVNLKTAKALGLTISKTILFRADEVIQ